MVKQQLSVWNFTIYKSSRQAFFIPESWRKESRWLSQTRQSGENEEKIIEIEIERLRPFKEHPFQVKDDKEMFLLQESIEKYGILNPLIVRPVPDGYYEIISGHRRKHAAEKLGYRKVPVIIRVLSEDDSILSMVDSNLHRERIIDFILSWGGYENEWKEWFYTITTNQKRHTVRSVSMIWQYLKLPEESRKRWKQIWLSVHENTVGKKISKEFR